MANLYFIRRVLYKLKKNYGFPISLYKILESQNDPQTGRKDRKRAVYDIRKAVILTPSDLKRTFNHDRAFAAAVTSRFSYGGFYDIEALYIMIDCRDLPRDFLIELQDFFIYNHKRYNIDDCQKIEPGLAYIIKSRELRGSEPTEIITEKIIQSLPLEQGVLNDLN